MPATQCDRQGGFTLVEMMFASLILVTATAVLITHLAISYKSTRSQRDRVHAYMVAKSILAEIHAYGAESEAAGIGSVDDLDDGVATNPTLTIATDGGSLVAPDHELSGNFQRLGQWVWSRQITIKPVEGIDNRKLRYASVQIFKRDGSGTERKIADLSAIVNSLAQAYPPTQVFDVYFVAVENIPGWWVHMETIRAFMEAMVADLERSNPGLSIRSHWITKASYGRCETYRPYINENIDSHNESTGVYYYPGLMPAGNASSFYYVPGAINARMATDLGETNGYDADLNPYPYALADFFNHGMRYPREKALHDLRVQEVVARKQAIAAAELAGTTPPAELWDMSEEPTWRLLLEDMCTNPDQYKNALVINLHGELIPMPSIRNYSDPAKSPGVLPEVRVVAHPEELRTYRDPSGTAHDDAAFRVYSWVTDPDGYGGAAVMPVPIMLEIPGVDLTDGGNRLRSGISLECLRGGVIVDSTDDYFAFAPATHLDDGPMTDEMHYAVDLYDPGSGSEKSTRIYLYNTPVVAPLVTHSVTGDDQGVANNDGARLYGMEYVPGCTEGALDFSNDLAADGTGAKNTARWRLRLPGSVLEDNLFITPSGTYFDPAGDVRFTVRTRITNTAIDEMTTGTLFPTPNDPDNLSETYTWWADSREDVPFTERSQFTGDPRHNPYRDLYDGDPDFPNGYNWFFDSLQNGTNAAASFPGLDPNRLENLWDGKMRQDTGRYFELLRAALVRSSAVYNTLTGWSYYYMGHGAEIGYDSANGYPSSIPTILTPFGSPGSTGFVNNITGSRRYVRGSGSSGDYWMCLPWLGELYPDSHYTSQWMALDLEGKIAGNMVPGTATDEFYQGTDTDVYTNSRHVTAGTAVDSATQRLASKGCGMFFNIGSSSSTFNHTGASGDGSLVGPGLELAANYNMVLPADTAINRPFSIATSNSPPGWDDSPYSGTRHLASIIRTYYTGTATGFTGSGVVELMPQDLSSSAYVVVNGLAETTTLGTGTLAKYSLLSMVHTYFEASESTLTNRIEMPPRVELLYPIETTELANPTSIDVTWDITWQRWDGNKYTDSTATSFTEVEGDIEYVLMYSKDSGGTWQHMVDDSAAQPGVRPSSSGVYLMDFGAGQEVHTWPTPAGAFPSGSYTIRVEAYRQNQSLHYSNHQKRIFIDR